MLPHKLSSLLLVATMLGSLLSLSIHAQEIDTACNMQTAEEGRHGIKWRRSETVSCSL